ncbi:hypothetical protein [Actinomadura sp. WAC 06369]|uniref:hypothetical protein n=1 Tax=Actinomadura sp. WAC 06369 TaxID=2203193 RepID=UPI000F771AEB|nr:hypothetical protein [Actinomadura sp. WAC 06369]RSN59577.1 hypothetical protein DMH08_22675 [Actinomadura sp. WAC 06369]
MRERVQAAERVLDGLAEATPRAWHRLEVALRSWWSHGHPGLDGPGPLGALVAAAPILGDDRVRTVRCYLGLNG